jgi:hypothetical protein
MSKNSISNLKEQKESRARQKAQQEAEVAASGRDPWDGKQMGDRVSFRVQQELKDAFSEQIPRHMNVTTAMRELMVQVAKGEHSL